MDKVELYTLLRDHQFTKGLPDEKVRELASIASLSRFEAGRRIFDEGETHKKMYLLVYGLVALYFHIPGRGEFRFETIGPGEVLGWSSLLPPFKKAAGAIAVENTLAISLEGEKLIRMAEEDKDFGCEVYKRIVEVVADRLRSARVRLLDIYGEQKARL